MSLARLRKDCNMRYRKLRRWNELTKDRYEALPEGYGLGHNMMAGAFAGIAVSSKFADLVW